MQTFLPYPDFKQSARALDNRRLGKQRVECLQILNTLYYGSRWINHPAVRMWRHNPRALASYSIAVCEVWRGKGFNDTCLDKIRFIADKFLSHTNENPKWLGNKEFHEAHQSNLLRKMPEFYGQYKWNVPNDLPYIWPV